MDSYVVDIHGLHAMNVFVDTNRYFAVTLLLRWDITVVILHMVQNYYSNQIFSAAVMRSLTLRTKLDESAVLTIMDSNLILF